MPAPVMQEDEALHREMERISLDWCMIYNPTDEDFYIEWAAKDGRPWKYLVPNSKKDIGWGLGKLEVQRYLAIWYCKHMKDLIVNKKGEAEAEKMLAERANKGQPTLTKFEEQQAIWGKTPRTTSDQELKSIYPILWQGVSREFGMEYTPSQGTSIDQATPEDKVLEGLKHKKYQAETTESMPKTAPKKEVKEELPSVEDIEALLPKHEKS